MADSKHRTVFRYLESGIRSGKFQPGAQLPTEVTLVQELGVSRPTVARAMRDLQNLGLVERRAGAGSYVREPKTAVTLGLLVPELGCGDIFDPICAQLARRAQRDGLGVFWGDAGSPQLHSRDGIGRLDVSSEGALQASDAFATRGVAGVFFAPLGGGETDRETNRKILRKLREADIRVVLLDRDVESFPERSEFDLVTVNHLVGQYLASKHLIQEGHQRLLYLQWPGVTDSLQKRIAGMQVGLGGADSSAKAIGDVVKGDPRDRAFVGDFIEEHRPDAVMCENDMIAIHLLQTLAAMEIRVPEDLSVVGFNDITMAQHLGTPLSTVHQPCRELGDVAIEVMQQRLNTPDTPPRTVLLEPRLVLRDSSRRSE